MCRQRVATVTCFLEGEPRAPGLAKSSEGIAREMDEEEGAREIEPRAHVAGAGARDARADSFRRFLDRHQIDPAALPGIITLKRKRASQPDS